MAGSVASDVEQYSWTPQPAAAALVHQLLNDAMGRCAPLAEFANALRSETGTRIVDWIDHLAVPASGSIESQLRDNGFVVSNTGAVHVWEHVDGLFPAVLTHRDAATRVAVKVESAIDFLAAQRVADAEIIGGPISALRMARFAAENDVELWAVERHGFRGFAPPDLSPELALAILRHGETFRCRRRWFDDDAAGFDYALQLIRAANDEIGVDRTCDLFFAAERAYWQSRNHAARVQKARQDKLGLGWANHDHHTYRSSRAQFTRLIAVLESLGFQCRERFYAGREAGWGAQVIEQPTCGITIFADVDLAPDEVASDFAHQPLPQRDALGTVGLWCKLHGEAFLQAGMHHLECQFDFDESRRQLREAGVETMAPFTDMPHLKQAFTTGEMWPVAESRIAAALAEGKITADQAAAFRQRGAVGSHLEILERNDGYKGFNQTGISDIILKTDPRLLSEDAAS